MSKLERDLAILMDQLPEPRPRNRAEWHPIETAPKDDTRIICGRFTGDAEAMQEGFVAVDWRRDTARGHRYNGYGEFNMSSWPPTHWMPLPEPPANPA